jgi:hypothetical protein
MENQQLFNELIEEVASQIHYDIQNGDVEPVEELLRFCPIQNLIEYLPEEKQDNYQYLLKYV